MPMYKRPTTPEDEMTDEELDASVNTPAPTTPEEQTWKKRYGDLRSHTQKQINEFKAQITDLTNKVNTVTSNNINLPTSEADVEEWTKKYPQVAAIVQALALKQAKTVNEGVEQRLKHLDERELESAKEVAMNKLRAIHADFDTLSVEPAFHDWLATKSQRVQDSIYENDTDYRDASDTISLFKAETNWGKKVRKENPRDNAREVRTNSNTRPANGLEPRYKESEILTMSGVEFAAAEEDIEKAAREGRIIYDLKDAKEAARG